WGKAASQAIDPAVRDRILDSPRARALANWQLPELSLDEIRRKIDGTGISDDELLLRYIMRGQEEIRAMRGTPRNSDYSGLQRPLLSVVQELAARKGFGELSLRKGPVSIRLASTRSEG
ncbi:MAG: hypothetical protein KGJ86_15310, partial [Chloroflexota bacterium]|nr:hypothetical protein [Chloroflexota bacterium]